MGARAKRTEPCPFCQKVCFLIETVRKGRSQALCPRRSLMGIIVLPSSEGPVMDAAIAEPKWRTLTNGMVMNSLIDVLDPEKPSSRLLRLSVPHWHHQVAGSLRRLLTT